MIIHSNYKKNQIDMRQEAIDNVGIIIIVEDSYAALSILEPCTVASSICIEVTRPSLPTLKVAIHHSKLHDISTRIYIRHSVYVLLPQ